MLSTLAISPICNHLGCTLEWDLQKNHCICPCHGSQYDSQGRVVRGPAKRSIPLITVVVKQNQIPLVDRKPVVAPR